MTTEADPLRPLLASIEAALDAYLPRHSVLSQPLIDAMRYAVLGGGKRIRPLLTCATAMSLGVDTKAALAPAAAIEFINAYSLIHDDLPVMDDDDLRRGRPTVHIVYGDAVAILAGDALQALAFETIARAETLTTDARLAMTEALARAAGWHGMVGGQAFDIAATGRRVPLEQLEAMHRAKTGALLTTAVDLGALAADAPVETRQALQDFGAAIGLAFQVVDDLLDVTQSTDVIGKRAGADAAAGKNTFPELLGIDGTQARAAELYREAIAALSRAGISGGPLHAIARTIVDRTF